jgi:anhydro-N-acetylmuramic acid kinase
MRVIGMISGTSFDAVEALLVELSTDGDALLVDLVAHHSVPYPDEIADEIAAVLPPALITMEQVCRLDIEIGHVFGTVAADLAADHGGADLVCSHGQTVFHLVEGRTARGCLQLGEPAFIAERCGLPVVSDVRNRDIALGGQGAPLASLIDVLLLGAVSAQRRGSLNLGGIANVTIVGPDHPPCAYDIGPANALIDAASSWISGGVLRLDKDGALAASGTAHEGLVRRLLDDAYFALEPPKSTGKELFNLDYLARRVGRDELAPEDLVASVTVASAESIAASLRPRALHEVVVAGGGTRNPTLMTALVERLPGVAIRPIDELGVPGAAKEALIFCVIGFLTAHGLPATVPSCTGAASAAVLGCLTPGRNGRLAASEEVVLPPARLVVRTPLPCAPSPAPPGS